MKATLIEYLMMLTIVLIILCIPGWWVFRSYQEARVYERLTGKEVSTWDALFVELRVTNE